mgnify:CR=1 FL=1
MLGCGSLLQVLFLYYNIKCTFCNTFAMHNIYLFLYTILLSKGVILLRKFKIPSVPPTTTKSIRFPNDVIEDVEKAISGKSCTFTAFVVEAVRVALENLDEDREKED